ncbi:MAG: O-acetylhomoserine aminocarboxypropyltransferase/cysteine synthase [Alphaproteobacteria bacterium]|nr:O-acetylhomoserine aminocarboxypropyltransferase/cysteine synthase [Alphaproteobacteria bacterium]MBV9062572.1 O-acetylhomoserine aminocarboxypropyltransferase/cysteine synthase [Alphaproteobacteria bacterium]
MRDETLSIHAGYETDPITKSVAVPIYQTVAYEFESAEHGAALFDLEVPGNIYTRLSNPTTAVLERRIAVLEGGVDALCVGSGMAAIHYAIANVAEAGTNIVSTPQLYGATYTLFEHVLRKQGIDVRFARRDGPADVESLIDENTRAVYCESIGNPGGGIADIEGLAEVAHRNGLPLIVDNTIATPILLKPIQFGADVVVHSLTKFVGGHGTTMGGAIVDSGNFPWTQHSHRFPMLTKPEAAYHGVTYTEQYGRGAYVARCRTVCQRNTGAILAPLSAFLLLQGAETLALRVERHLENTEKVAEFLSRHPKVAWCEVIGRGSALARELSLKYLRGRSGPFLTFGLRGGFEEGKRFYNALKLFKRLVNIGDAKSLACHPASTTHRQLTEQELAQVGVKPEMIRLCIGIEHIDDILADLDQALAAACPSIAGRAPALRLASSGG